MIGPSPPDFERCEKCGSANGFDGPAHKKEKDLVMCGFFPSFEINEYLAYTCRNCGYIKQKPVKDAKDE